VHSPGPIIWTFKDLTIYLRAYLFFVIFGARKNSSYTRSIQSLRPAMVSRLMHRHGLPPFYKQTLSRGERKRRIILIILSSLGALTLHLPGCLLQYAPIISRPYSLDDVIINNEEHLPIAHIRMWTHWITVCIYATTTTKRIQR
jgi:hypothetical protein